MDLHFDGYSLILYSHVLLYNLILIVEIFALFFNERYFFCGVKG